MANIKDHSFIDHYPLHLLYIAERRDRFNKLLTRENELYYETPTIDFNSDLDSNTVNYHFRKHLEEYLEIIIKQTDEYIEAIYPDICAYIPDFDIVATYSIYFRKFNGGFKGLEKQVLSFQDDKPKPRYYFKGILSNFFPTSLKLRAKANIFRILRK